MKLKENKGMSLIVFTIILAVLLVVAGGAIVYLLNNQGALPKTPTGEQNNVVNNDNENESEKIKLTDFVGSYKFGMGPDGSYSMEITSVGEGLKINWVSEAFNGTEAQTIEVKSYKLQDNKLILEVEGQSNSIIFKENGKTYFTIEGIENEEGFSYFPIEMIKK